MGATRGETQPAARMVRVDLRIEEEPIDTLDEHALVPIAFAVERILAVRRVNSGLGGILLSETGVDVPWVKDYDLIKGEGPTRWSKRFDTSNWGLIAAYDRSERIINLPRVSLLLPDGDSVPAASTAALTAGQKALTDTNNAISWANGQAQSIMTQGQQIDNAAIVYNQPSTCS